MTLAPRMTAYLAQLPAGVDSYPDVLEKASVYREYLVGVDCEALRRVLPPPLLPMIDAPPPSSAWVSEVHVAAFFLALSDTLGEEAAFLELAYRANRRLLGGPMYRLLFSLLGPRTILKGAQSRWGHFHRGVTMHVAFADDERGATVRLTFPPKLLVPLLFRSYGEAFRAAAEVAGAKDASVRIEAHGDGYVRFAIDWA